MARRQKGLRQRGKKVTVAVLVGGWETKHRGPTLRAALLAAERARLGPGCHFKWTGWGPHQRWAKGLRRLPGRTAGADGEVVCNGRERGSAYITVYRPKAQQAWHKRQRIERARLRENLDRIYGRR